MEERKKRSKLWKPKIGGISEEPKWEFLVTLEKLQEQLKGRKNR
jgi:hypothetical protein